MIPELVVLAQVFILILMFLSGLIGLSFIARKLLFRPQRPRDVLAADDSRLRRLEEGMDAIAVEIERISEAQRFTTKLLTSRIGEEGIAGGK